MNLVIIYGKIVSKVDFKFIYDRYNKVDSKGIDKRTSIAKCKIELLNGSIVEIYGYDEIADFMYRNYKEDVLVVVEGKLDNKMRIEIKNVVVY